MKYATAPVATLLCASPLRAETPCDFKGISVGSKMTPAEFMSALGVMQYKMNPKRRSLLGPSMDRAVKKYGLLAAGEHEDWEIGPYCEETSCRIPYGVAIGNDNMPVNVFVAFHGGQITGIDLTFSETNWDEIRPILDQKYGANWTTEHEEMGIQNYETKEWHHVQRITLHHVTNGTNTSTKDHCQIWATNFDLVFEHHDALGPYHSIFEIKLVSKNF
jgi:hypothetical protein